MRLYRWLLRLCPAALRREYGAAMEETFARRMADARTAGRWPRLRVMARELIGIVVLALSERWGAGARAHAGERGAVPDGGTHAHRDRGSVAHPCLARHDVARVRAARLAGARPLVLGGRRRAGRRAGSPAVARPLDAPVRRGPRHRRP